MVSQGSSPLNVPETSCRGKVLHFIHAAKISTLDTLSGAVPFSGTPSTVSKAKCKKKDWLGYPSKASSQNVSSAGTHC